MLRLHVGMFHGRVSSCAKCTDARPLGACEFGNDHENRVGFTASHTPGNEVVLRPECAMHFALGWRVHAECGGVGDE